MTDIRERAQHLVPMVVEQTPRGERACEARPALAGTASR